MAKKVTPSLYEERINKSGIATFVEWPHGFAGSKSKALVRGVSCPHEWPVVPSSIAAGQGCPECAKGKRRAASVIAPEVYIKRLNEAWLGQCEFIGWADEYRNAHTKAEMKCLIHESAFTSTVNHLLRGHGCPDCGRDAQAAKRRRPEEDSIAQVEATTTAKFVKWVNGYENNKSPAVWRCSCGGTWESTLAKVLFRSDSCPGCTARGYNPQKPGTLYALRSGCGSMVKIGISNNYTRRHVELARGTPFEWDCVELVHHEDGVVIAKLERATHKRLERAVFEEAFDGHTEWFRYTEAISAIFESYRQKLG